MEENLLRLILWLVFIAVWLVSGIAKKRRDDRRVESGEAPGPEELREYFGEDEPEEEPHVSQEDEFRKFLRTISGAEQPEAETVTKGSGKAPEPARGRPVRPPAPQAGEPVPGPEYRPQAPPVHAAGAGRRVWGAEKLRTAVVLSEILSPPRALRPYRAVKRDSFRR